MFKLITGLCVISLFAITSCTNKPPRLPFAGNWYLDTIMVDGKQVVDTVYPTIPPFSFTDQDGNVITNETLKGKIYVADFVFLSCKSICPKMNVQMKRLHDLYAANPKIVFLTHTFDPERDTVERIKKFMESQQAEASKWYFVRGPEEDILRIANKGYFYNQAFKDSVNGKPGEEYQHEGWFVLVDKNQHIRSLKGGTDQFEVDKLIKDIEILLKEE